MRIVTHRFIAVFSMALAAAVTLGASQNVVAQEATSPDENLKQIALTDAQIENFVGAQKEMVPIVAKAPEADKPDPKVMEQLEAVAKKYKFVNYAEYRDVDENIGLVMSGIDPATKKYVGPDAVIKKDIALIDSENLTANDKKRQLDEEQSKLKSLPGAREISCQYRSGGEELRQDKRRYAASPIGPPGGIQRRPLAPQASPVPLTAQNFDAMSCGERPRCRREARGYLGGICR